MKLIGDVSEKDRKLAEELTDMEHFLANEPRLTPEKAAKGYVCCAHDWFQMDAEEQGFKLLDKAERVCPGYFKEIMVQHTKEDKDFAKLVSNLSIELTYLLINNIKDLKESKK